MNPVCFCQFQYNLEFILVLFVFGFVISASAKRLYCTNLVN
jgi:hypothetical protein